MNKTMNHKKWIFLCLLSLVSVVVLLMMLVWAIDPFCRFRVREGTYLLDASHVAPGLVMNYDYTTLMLGSSMTENFDMNQYEAIHGEKALRVSIGGMGFPEMAEYIRLAEIRGTAKRYILCIDPASFARDVELRTDEYLFDQGRLSDLKYLLNFDAIVRALPKSIVVDLLKIAQVELPGSLKNSTSVPRIGRWGNHITFSEKTVLSNYFSGAYATTKLETVGLEEQMKLRVDQLFSDSDADWEKFTFFFPPYSVLYWHQIQQEGAVDAFFRMREYFVEEAVKRGAVVFDFQTIESTLDLNNYKDTTHYSPQINEQLISMLGDSQYMVTPENITAANNVLWETITIFEKRFVELENEYRGVVAKNG